MRGIKILLQAALLEGPRLRWLPALGALLMETTWEARSDIPLIVAGLQRSNLPRGLYLHLIQQREKIAPQ